MDLVLTDKQFEHIDDMTGNRHSVAAERNVDVVAEEGRKRNVPSSPEIGDRGGDIGIIEIFFVVEAYHKTHTDSHIGICRKIEIELEHIGEGA